jgi:N-acetyltransferase 10
MCILTLDIRYEIEGDDAAWKDAEKRVKQAAKSGKSNPLVSVKTKAKRKAEEAEVPDEGRGEKGHGKAKKVKKDKGGRR